MIKEINEKNLSVIYHGDTEELNFILEKILFKMEPAFLRMYKEDKNFMENGVGTLYEKVYYLGDKILYRVNGSSKLMWSLLKKRSKEIDKQFLVLE